MDATVRQTINIEPKIIKEKDGSAWLKLDMYEAKHRFSRIYIFLNDNFDYTATRKVFADFAERFDEQLDEFLKGGD